MGHDEIDHLFDDIDVGALQKALRELAKTIGIGVSLYRFTGSVRGQKEVLADRLEACRIDEAVEFDITQLLCRLIAPFVSHGTHFAVWTNGDAHQCLGGADLDIWHEPVALGSNDIAFIVDLKIAGSSVGLAPARQLDLEKASALYRHIQIPFGVLETSLGKYLAHIRQFHPQSHLDTGGDSVAIGAHHARIFDVLVDQILEVGSALLEAYSVDVGDIVGDHIQIGLLGRHPRCCCP